MCQCAHGYRGPNCYESDGMCVHIYIYMNKHAFAYVNVV